MAMQVSHEGEAILRFRSGLFAFAVLAFAGCGTASSGYDESLRYPPRADVVVIRPPYAEPTELHPPGRRDEFLRTYSSEIGGKIVDPAAVDVEVLAVLTAALEETFGTPAAPKLVSDFTNGEQLAAGSKLYRSQCAHCHGLTGEGRGPTGLFLEPPPRDFRNGVFKSGAGTPRPSGAALQRVIRHGVPGTQMQPYDLLSDQEVTGLLTYVVHLSIRGECETKALTAAFDPEEGLLPIEVAALVQRTATASLEAWRSGWKQELPGVELPTDAEAVRRGYALTTMVGCTSCHGANLQGGAFRYDVWGNVTRVPDLTKADWKWGREPGDLHARIRHGIAAVNMPANPGISERQVLDLTSFLSVIGRPDLLPDDVRKEIHKP